MAATWDEFLVEASLGGIVFDCVSTRIEGGRELDKREYPNRDGADVEDKARQGAGLSLRAIFADDAYPERYLQFLALLEAGGILEFVHPVRGRMMVGVETYSDVADAEDADFGLVEVKLAEHTEGALGPFQGTDAASLANLVRSACDDADLAAKNLQAYLDGLSPSERPAALQTAASGTAAVTTGIAAAATTLETTGDAMSLTEITALLNGNLFSVENLLSDVSNYQVLEARDLGVAVIAAASRLSSLGDGVAAAKPPLIDVLVPADMPLLLFAHQRYGDSSRAEEIARLNSLPDPVQLRARQKLVIYAS